MTLWAKNRLVWATLAAVAACLGISVLFPTVTIAVPDIRNGTLSHVPLTTLMMAAPALVAGVCISRRWQAFEIRNVRQVWIWDILLAFLTPVCLIGVAMSATPLMAAIRTGISLIGVVLISSVFLPPAWASVPSLGWFVASLVLGRSGDHYDFWAWPADGGQNTPAWAGSVLIAILGGVLYCTAHHPSRWENTA